MKLFNYLILGVCVWLFGWVGLAGAQTIPNPSFEANSFTTSPGYAANNGGSITGWTTSNTGRVGLNPAGGNPFADNGAIPDGNNVAFIQATGSTNTLSTTISGLVAGQTYFVGFYANHRSIYQAGTQDWSVNGGDFTSFTASPAVGGANDYYPNFATFTATGSTAGLVLRNGSTNGQDATVLVDNFFVTTLVTTLADDGSTGSLRQVIALAPAGATITFSPFLLLAKHPTVTLTNQIVLTRSVTINGGSDNLAISGNHARRIFQVNSGVTATFNYLILTNGSTTNSSGGAINNAGTLTLNNCTLANNSAFASGGAIYNTAGTLTLNNCTLVNNAALSAGAIGNYNSSTLTINSCTFANNSASAYGGAIENYAPLTLNNCTLANNSAYSAGAIYNGYSTLTLNHCTLALNQVIGIDGFAGGGAINMGSGSLALTNCILAGNTAASGTGPDVWQNAGTVTASYCLVGNGTNSTIANLSNGNRVGTGGALTNALLAPLGNYGGPTQTMPPLAGSPAIDKSGAVVLLTTDQRGFPRPVDGDGNGSATADIGAVEVSVSFVTNTNDTGAGSLRKVAIQAPEYTTVAFAPALAGKTIALASQIVLANGVIIDASSLAGGIVVRSSATNRLFYLGGIDSSSILLSGLTLAGGTGDDGGAVYNDGDNVTLMGCTLTNNTASNRGGAIYSYFGSLTLTACTLTGNSANPSNQADIVNIGSGQSFFYGGGAIYMDGLADNGTTSSGSLPLTLTRCRLDSNRSGTHGGGILSSYCAPMLMNCTLLNNIGTDGGALYCFHRYAGLTSCTLLGNSTTLNGGAIRSDTAGLYVTNCTFAGNATAGDGGAISMDEGNSVLLNCRLAGNRAAGGNSSYGGAIYNHSATMTVNQCTLTDNSADGYGGAYYNLSGASLLTFNQCSLSGNTGLYGGAIYNDGSALTVNQCMLTGNSAGSYGGAVYNLSGENLLTLNQSTLANNTGPYGGAIYTGSSQITLNQCTLSGNTANAYGGAILNYLSALTLSQCTLANNTASYDGGALENQGSLRLTQCTLAGNTSSSGGGGAIDYYTGSSFSLTACILAGNTAGSGTGPDLWMEVTNTFIATNCLVGNGADSKITNNISGNLVGNSAAPLNASLASLGNYGGLTQTLPPRTGSPAIDKGGTTALTTDQRGYPRVTGSALDIGAVEAQIAANNNRPVLTNAMASPLNHTFQFTFANAAQLDFSVLTSTNVALPLTNWSSLGHVTEVTSGQYQFTQTGVTNPAQFYCVVSP